MDAFGIVYLQYWTKEDADANFIYFLEGSLDLVLSLANLDMQETLFKITMNEVGSRMMQKPIDINLVTCMWRNVEANTYLLHSLSEYIKVTKLAIVMVLGNVQDERTFNMLSFMKNKLWDPLIMHLEHEVEMKMQNFYILENFLYAYAYNRRATKKKPLYDTK